MQLSPATKRNVIVACSTEECGAVEKMTFGQLDAEDEREVYLASCAWRQLRWRTGWRWVHGYPDTRVSCPSCPPVIVDNGDGQHLTVPRLLALLPLDVPPGESE
jgi:hypothetical protein